MTQVEIVFQNGENLDGFYRFRPRETVKGTVTIRPDRNINCNHLYIRLEWHTEGRGTRFSQKVAEMDVFQGTLAQGIARTFDFEFTIPKKPWSFEGHYVSVVWNVQVQIDIPMARDVNESAVFLVEPDREPADSVW